MGTVTGKTTRLNVPGEDAWIEIRALGWLTLDTARTKRLHQIVEMAKTLKDVTLPVSSAPAAPDPLMSYDRLYLLESGITAWSYSDTVDVEQLDDPTAQWAAREILAYSVPGETEVGKASSRSTATSLTLNGRDPQKNGS
jgi:hypothetical protein